MSALAVSEIGHGAWAPTERTEEYRADQHATPQFDMDCDQVGLFKGLPLAVLLSSAIWGILGLGVYRLFW